MHPWLEQAPCGYLSFKDDGSIIYLNETLLSWLGYSASELVGLKVENIFTVATRIFHNTHFFPLLRLHGKADEIFLSLRGKSQNDIPVLANARRRIEEGSPINHCVFIAIFQRQKYEEEILAARQDAEKALHDNQLLRQLQTSLENRTLEVERQYQKQLIQHNNLTEFNKIVTHDFQEPIRKILLFADLLTRNLAAGMTEENSKTISRIVNATTRLRSLTAGLQQYLTVDSDDKDAKVDLNEVLDAARTRVIAGRHLNTLNLAYTEIPPIHGFRAQLELMFYHLFDNAVQFAEPTRILHINVIWVVIEENLYKLDKDKYQYVENLRLSVSDNGIGFENEYKQYVTGLLNKLNPSTEGLGMGLSIIKKVVDNHGGTLSIESRMGVGTTFTMVLPRSLFAGTAIGDS